MELLVLTGRYDQQDIVIMVAGSSETTSTNLELAWKRLV